MGKYINLIGKKFGRLSVLDRGGYNKYKRIKYKCKCDCGKMTYVLSSLLVSGKTKSCGCYGREIRKKLSHQRKSKLIGRKFNRLIVIKNAPSNNKGRSVFECMCECGNKLFVCGWDLISGNTQSCGCKKIMISKMRFQDKEFILRNTMRQQMYWEDKRNLLNP